jgi:hypothetical protein
MFQVPPPPPVPVVPEVVRTDSSYLSVARRDVPLVLERGKTSEKALIRYQLLVRTDMEAIQAPAASTGVIELTCTWTISTWLQREPCFESLTGRLACGETYTTRLEDRERGSEKTAEPASACNVTRANVVTAQTRLGQTVASSAAARFEDDLARRLTPDLAKAGLSVKPRTK